MLNSYLLGGITMFGTKKENGFWIAEKSTFKFLLLNRDALYIAVWKFRLRLMKPFRKQQTIHRTPKSRCL